MGLAVTAMLAMCANSGGANSGGASSGGASSGGASSGGTEPGDPASGRAIVMNRQVSACLLCHSGPFPDPHLQGMLAPSLSGAGSRLSAADLRLRLTDPARFNPDTIMPSYAATTGLNRVGKPWAGKPVLTTAQIDDVVAFLTTLRDP